MRRQLTPPRHFALCRSSAAISSKDFVTGAVDIPFFGDGGSDDDIVVAFVALFVVCVCVCVSKHSFHEFNDLGRGRRYVRN